MRKNAFILEDFDTRKDLFIDALFHCWGQQEEYQVGATKMAKFKFIHADEFYQKMMMYGFTVD